MKKQKNKTVLNVPSITGHVFTRHKEKTHVGNTFNTEIRDAEGGASLVERDREREIDRLSLSLTDFISWLAHVGLLWLTVACYPPLLKAGSEQGKPPASPQPLFHPC